MKERLPNELLLIKGLEYITHDDLTKIDMYANGLSLEACYDALMIDPDELSEREAYICNQVHKRGRAKAIQSAATNLFAAMRQRNGGNACLDYLKQMSEDFSVEVESTQAKAGFSFKVVMPGKD